MLDPVVAAGFENVHEAGNIGIDVGARVFDTVSDTGLGSEVDHAIETMFGKSLFDSSAVAQTAPSGPVVADRPAPAQPPVPEAQAYPVRSVQSAALSVPRLRNRTYADL